MADLAIQNEATDLIFGGLKELKAQTDLKHGMSAPGYDPFSFPANIELAKKHGQAKRVYVSKLLEDKKAKHKKPKDKKTDEKTPEAKYEVEPELCMCCSLPVVGQKISLTSDLDSLYHLGSGYALYFRFIKYAIGLLLLVLAISGIFNLITDANFDHCTEPFYADSSSYCVQGYIITYSLANKRNEQDILTAQVALNLATVILIMFFFHFLRYQLRKTEVKADDDTTTPSDYTIVIEGLPISTTDDEIRAWIHNIDAKENLQIEKIIRPRKIKHYISLIHQLNRIEETRDRFVKKSTCHGLTQKEKLAFQVVENKLSMAKSEVKKIKDNDGLENCPIAYVVFTNAKDADCVRSKFVKPYLQEILGYFKSKIVKTFDTIKGVQVKVERAPEPNDIVWENLGYTKQERRKKQLITNYITAILVILGFGLIILVNYGQNSAMKRYGRGSSVVQGLSIVASIVIFMTNFLLSLTITYLTARERHITDTKVLRGIAQKLTVAQFVNTAFTTLFAELILAEGDDSNKLHAMNFYGKGGLLENIFWVFITNALLTPALIIFDSGYFLKLFYQYQLNKQGPTNKRTQKQANETFEGTKINLPVKFAAMIKVILMACLYAPMLPFTLVIAIVGLILTYWADKYALLRRHSLPDSLDDELTDSMIEMLEWAAFTFSMGNIFAVFSLQDSSGYIAFTIHDTPMVWSAFAISLFHIIFPMGALNERLFPIKDKVTEKMTYEQAQPYFISDYDVENPLTRNKALEYFSERVKERRQNGRKGKTGGSVTFVENLNKGKLGFSKRTFENDFNSLDMYASKTRLTSAANSPTKRGKKDELDLDLDIDLFKNASPDMMNNFLLKTEGIETNVKELPIISEEKITPENGKDEEEQPKFILFAQPTSGKTAEETALPKERDFVLNVDSLIPQKGLEKRNSSHHSHPTLEPEVKEDSNLKEKDINKTNELHTKQEPERWVLFGSQPVEPSVQQSDHKKGSSMQSYANKEEDAIIDESGDFDPSVCVETNDLQKREETISRIFHQSQINRK